MPINEISGINAQNMIPNAADKATKADYNKATDDELFVACKQFETYFIEQIFKGMKKTVDSQEEKGDYVKMFEDKLDTEYATAATDQGGIGLAQILYDQMKVNYHR